ncbi:hypothetical protein N869_01015 [Cellulomonas bogoriensis 69B4 = DSM 16987]|uniref:Uncharacterized protein n=1 Tax=Cellulomonas bogoriensis 69B4 = DSM 16987 TaxID=1386082 RepID=A0A0A0BY86_9CELL|nr:hypothetical protein N869_01015 [Cellulomonas bogoriensis 69B4 = DSM 16987]
MIVLSCSHPLTEPQLERLQVLAGGARLRVLEPDLAHLDLDGDLVGQVRRALDALPLRGSDWESLPFLVSLPALSLSAAVLVAEVHGRCGHFPTVVRRVRSRGPVVMFEVADLIGLQDVRTSARAGRDR